MTGLLAYVDESVRPGRYLLGAVIVDGDMAGHLRRQVRKLLLPGQRKLHFKTEGNRRRRELIDSLGRLGVEAVVYSCRLSNDVGAEGARSRCLAGLVRESSSAADATPSCSSRVGSSSIRSTASPSVAPVDPSHCCRSNTCYPTTTRCSGFPTRSRGRWAPVATGCAGSARS